MVDRPKYQATTGAAACISCWTSHGCSVLVSAIIIIAPAKPYVRLHSSRGTGGWMDRPRKPSRRATFTLNLSPYTQHCSRTAQRWHLRARCCRGRAVDGYDIGAVLSASQRARQGPPRGPERQQAPHGHGYSQERGQQGRQRHELGREWEGEARYDACYSIVGVDRTSEAGQPQTSIVDHESGAPPSTDVQPLDPHHKPVPPYPLPHR